LSKSVRGNARAAALTALSEDQMKQLAAFAHTMSRGTGKEGSDLLQEAFVRWLGSDKPIEGTEQTCDFLRAAISSIRSNTFRHEKVVRRYEGVRALRQEDDEEDLLDQAADPAASTEGPLFVQQLYDLCEDDEEVQLLLMKQWDRATAAEIRTELGWDETKYQSVLKRKRRLVIRWTLEGKLT
jgi:DNA-directed RNA polymerase specialized sigma24 family protein